VCTLLPLPEKQVTGQHAALVVSLLFSGALLLSATAFAASTLGAGGAFNVCDFSARADGKTTDTVAISSAIAAATSAGGGIVHFPAGQYGRFRPPRHFWHEIWQYSHSQITLQWLTCKP